MTVDVYSNTNCPGCMMTHKLMKAKGLKFNAYKTEKHPDVIRYVKKLGISQAPLVFVKDASGKTVDFWHGFHPAKIMKYAEA